MRRLRIGLAQVNVTVGDIPGNTRKLVDWIERGRAEGCDLLAFPELAITGYPPEDLLFKTRFIEANLRALRDLIPASRGLTVVVGFVDRREGIYNAAALLHDGALAGVYHKQHLPNYGVFDEKRYFHAGQQAPVFTREGTVIGINVCEDIWYPTGPATAQALAGAELIVTINASPYHAEKWRQRAEMLATRAADNAAIVAYCNLVGGQDELVFDGQSFVFNERGERVALGRAFEEDLVMADLDMESVSRARLRTSGRGGEIDTRVPVPRIELSPIPVSLKPQLPVRRIEPLAPVEEIYRALTLGTRDYVRKNGFQRVVIGLSGGIDSSLVACVAVDALGRENVVGVTMPSPFSSRGTRSDARRLARILEIEFHQLPITRVFGAYRRALAGLFKGLKEDAAEENIQARIRGNLLMALSNKFGWLVLTTGNKSELGVGYCTLYGDMAGGFAVIKDVPKTLVYTLARYRNDRDRRPVIPESVLTRPPSAELRPGQTDQDTLPPYEVLDPILQAYVEEDRSLPEIVALGYDEATVRRVIGMVDRNEYKRRQGPPGIKITPRAFGKDWRLPIVNRFREESSGA
jgi:NAD+ synthase (glutamine-hydrolysing)